MLQVRRKTLNLSLSSPKLQKMVTDGKPSSNANGSRKIVNGASQQVIISRVCRQKTTKTPQDSIPLIELD